MTCRSSPRCTAARPGAGALNTLLQQHLTPSRDGLPERRAGGRVSRIGDKVTQIRNNYDKGQAGVFNGTLGVITALDPDDCCTPPSPAPKQLVVLVGSGPALAAAVRTVGAGRRHTALTRHLTTHHDE